MQRRGFLELALMAAPPPKTPPMAERISAFGLSWQVISAADWRVDDGELQLVTPRDQKADPRRPVQFALAEIEPLAAFTAEYEVRRQPGKGSTIFVYAWMRDGYFNYVHLSDDAPAKVEVHNGVFHCFGGDRVRISPLEGPASYDNDDWQKVRIAYDASKGLVQAWVNGKTTPALKGIDLSLGAGRIGLGSFTQTGRFRNFKLTR